MKTTESGSPAGQVRSKQRVADHGEVFTAEREVNAMLDLVKQETERVDSRFLEPACGDGNFVVEILRRKLEAAKKRSTPPRKKTPLPIEFEKQSLIAVASIYGVDLLLDNVIACRERLYGIWNRLYRRLQERGERGLPSSDPLHLEQKHRLRQCAHPENGGRKRQRHGRTHHFFGMEFYKGYNIAVQKFPVR